jgi:hypothetical protein
VEEERSSLLLPIFCIMSIWEKCTRLFLLWTPSDLDDFLQIVQTISSNIIEHPNEQKYKELNLSKGVIQKKIVSRLGGLDFMCAIGFEEVSKEDVKYLQFNGIFLIVVANTTDTLLQTHFYSNSSHHCSGFGENIFVGLHFIIICVKRHCRILQSN